MRGLFIVIPDGVALVVCAIAVLTDMRRLRIPNRLTFTAAAFGFALNGVLGLVAGGASGALHALIGSLLGAALGLLVFGLPAAIDLVGMGDVKLMIALGALIRWPLALPLALYVAVSGGLVALGYMILAGRSTAHRMPYGLAIAIGCTWAIASRCIVTLRLLDIG